ncbi:MAG: hypothetical protein ACI83W_002360 [Marinoscillum sp.]|jgi:hypothetical protein
MKNIALIITVCLFWSCDDHNSGENAAYSPALDSFLIIDKESDSDLLNPATLGYLEHDKIEVTRVDGSNEVLLSTYVSNVPLESGGRSLYKLHLGDIYAPEKGQEYDSLVYFMKFDEDIDTLTVLMESNFFTNYRFNGTLVPFTQRDSLSRLNGSYTLYK